MRFIITLFCFLFTTVVLAQQPMAINLTEKEGLPDKEFYRLLEDDKGFIWLAADKGLYRYDGFQFKQYIHPDQIGLSVFSVVKDRDDIIWYTNLSNQIFYIKNGKVHLFKELKEFFRGNVIQIFAHNSTIIFLGSSRLMIYDKNTGKLEFKNNTDRTRFYSEVISKDNNIYAFTLEGSLVRIDSTFTLTDLGKKMTFAETRVRGATLRQVGDSYLLTTMHKDKSSEFYILDTDFEKKFSFLKLEIPEKFIINSLRVFNEEIYLLTSKGVYIYKLINQKLKLQQKIFEGTVISDALKDSKGNLWLTTLNHGVYVVPNPDLKSNFTAPESNRIRKIFRGKENEIFLIGTGNEFYIFNTDTQKTTTIEFKNSSEIEYMFYEKSRDLYYLQSVESFNAVRFKNNKVHIIREHLSHVIKDHFFVNKDTLLMATGKTSMLINLKDVSKPRFDAKSSYGRAYSCYGDKYNNQYYFGTVKGFHVYNNNFIREEIKNGDKSIYIKDITSSKDTVWALSFKKGVYKIEQNKINKQLTCKDGLLSNINSFIKYDSVNNSIWLAGDKGIQKLNLTTNKFSNLTKNNGVSSYEFLGMEIINGRVYVGTTTELFSFNTEKIFDNLNTQNKPLPYFKGIKIDNVNKEITKNYIISSNVDKLEIAFNTNGFLSKEHTSYQYRLLQNRKEDIPWQEETSQSNTVVYNKLAQGNYIFQLKAKEGENTSDIQELRFTVKGVFYTQWWFFLLITLSVSSFLWYYFNRKNKQLKEKQKLILDKQNKELENIFLKLESLRSQMNPHFIFNALNSIQDYILNNEKKLARTYLVKFSRLIRMYLEHSQKNRITVREELGALNFYLELEKDRFEDSFTFIIDVDENLDQDTVEIPTFLIQPYVENAIKHGLLHRKENRKLNLSFRINEELKVLECLIQDNGVGRVFSKEINNRKAFKPKSFSSEANAKRISLLNKTRETPIKLEIIDQYDSTNKPTGTLVKLQIPIDF
ncbi:histidine kinase [uncultured Tenacibaculum sp.]|uniref:sensor histidine kinase n=1 Tax=uncultured Tenacibaculum sp. TaxID=174713 RepID=UPI00260F769F|nr:histidine kinase [uncultured Tenacibaculum sp.]